MMKGRGGRHVRDENGKVRGTPNETRRLTWPRITPPRKSDAKIAREVGFRRALNGNIRAHTPPKLEFIKLMSGRVPTMEERKAESGGDTTRSRRLAAEIEQIVARWRDKLVNLTASNRLRNFRITKTSTVPVVYPNWRVPWNA
jgi:hypothetical protein